MARERSERERENRLPEKIGATVLGGREGGREGSFG